jgi:hypothetical protein
MVNRGPVHSHGWDTAEEELKQYNIHASETAWIGTDFDAVVQNNEEGLDNLYGQIKRLVTDLRDARVNQI